MSQLIHKKRRGGNNAKPLETRKRFLEVYEESCGNVSAASAAAGINRRTYYRWIQSPSRVNQEFRERINSIRPEERLLDMAEAVMLQRLREGDSNAARFILSKRGRNRGYGQDQAMQTLEQFPVRTPERALIEKVADACLAAMEKYAEQIKTIDDKWSVVQQFAKARNVDPTQLAGRVGLTIETEIT